MGSRRKGAGMVRWHLAGMFALLLLGPSFAADEPKKESPPLPLDLRVKYKHGKTHTLQFSVTNRGPKAIDCTLWHLPWCGTTSMTLVLVPAKGNVPLRDDWGGMIMDSIFTEVQLKPNEAVTHDMDLTARFHGLDKVLAECGVDVFWSYQLKLPEGKQSRRFGGWLFIPQAK